MVSESELELGEEEFEIDNIVDSRIRKLRGKPILEYRIHWKGYDSEEDSWTTADQFDDDDPPVLEFYKAFPKKPSTANMGGKTKVKPAPERPSPSPIRQTTASPPPSVRKAETPPPISRTKEASVTIVGSPVRRVPSSPMATKSTDIRSFFGGANKENRDPSVRKETKPEKKEIVKDKSKERGKEKEKPVVKSEKVKPEKKKRKTEEEDEDFVMMDDVEIDEPEDDFESNAEDGDAAAESGGDDLESEHESGESAI